MRVIQALQGNRPVIVRLLDQLVRMVPEGVFYTSLQADAQTVSIEGIAESNNRVSSLMRRLEASRWLQAPSLDAVQATPDCGTQATHFKMSVGIELPEAAVEQPL